MPSKSGIQRSLTTVRQITGVTCVLGFILSAVFVVPIYLRVFNGEANFTNEFEMCLALARWTLGPIGFLLAAEFCLGRWPRVEKHEGLRACKIVLGSVLVTGCLGGILGASVYQGGPINKWATIGAFTAGFAMFWGYALALGIRRLLRMLRQSNSD